MDAYENLPAAWVARNEDETPEADPSMNPGEEYANKVDPEEIHKRIHLMSKVPGDKLDSKKEEDEDSCRPTRQSAHVALERQTCREWYSWTNRSRDRKHRQTHHRVCCARD